MNNAWRVRASIAIVSSLIVAGCDSTQPDRIETRSASMNFETIALVEIWDCYQTPFLFCFPSLANEVQEKSPRALPWNYSLKITIIRAGTIDEQVAVSSSGVVGSSVEFGDGIEDFISLTAADPNMPPVPDKDVGGTIFSNGNKVSTGSPIYQAFIGVNPGVTNILGTEPAAPNVPATFDLSLNTGDTVIVRARKQTIALSPRYRPLPTNIAIEAFLTVSGVQVAVQGPTKSSTGNGTGFTFSFTVQ